MSLLSELSKDRRVVLYAVVVALAIICIGAFGLKFGLDLEGGSYLQLQLQGAVAQIDVAAERILEVQFNASSIEKHGKSHVVTVPGKLEATLADDLGYSGAKIAERDNTTKITIMAAPETVITNYLKESRFRRQARGRSHPSGMRYEPVTRDSARCTSSSSWRKNPHRRRDFC